MRRAAITILSALLAAGGCAPAPPLRPLGPAVLSSGEPPDFGRFADLPRPRVGCLPFHGPFTLYCTADPQRLGEHRYAWPAWSEVDRGIVYTKRGGFVDLSHLRKGADLTAYFASRFEVALLEGWSCIQVRSREPSIYRVYLELPDDWDDIEPQRREALAREVAIRLGQRLAVQSLAWHEIITWFGYRALAFVPEDGSAFTYDDQPSHLLGAIVAGEALRRRDVDYDVGPDETDRAVRAVEGLWWRGGAARRRLLELGVDAPLVPWLAPGLWPGEEPQPLQLPGLEDVDGLDLTGVMLVHIDPRIFETGRIRRSLPDAPKLIDADRHLPQLVAHIRAEWLEEQGPGADEP